MRNLLDMTMELFVISAVMGVLAGFVVAWLISANRVRAQSATRIEEVERRASQAEGHSLALEAAMAELREQTNKADALIEQLRAQLVTERQAKAVAETELKNANIRLIEERRTLEEARAKLSDAFKSLAGDVLNQSNTAFLNLARETFQKILAEAKGDLGKKQEAIDGLLRPMSESLHKFDEHVRGLEKSRQQAYTGLEGCINNLVNSQHQLQRETANLVTALRAPQVRGRWGELTLRRVVELSGMSDHCDFTEQMTVDSDAGRQRPDLIVHLPGERELVVDAKVALDAFLDAVAAGTDEQRNAALSRHAAQMRTHMVKLSAKKYWEQFPNAPEFVVMFIPGESFFAAAVDADRRLVEDALEKRVVLATPATLIALIRSVAFSWRQEQIARNTQEISDLGKQLYERMKVLIEHVSAIGDGLEKAGRAYNSAVGSLESRVLPAARRFRDLGAAAGGELPTLATVDTSPRSITVPESDFNERV